MFFFHSFEELLVSVNVMVGPSIAGKMVLDVFLLMKRVGQVLKLIHLPSNQLVFVTQRKQEPEERVKIGRGNHLNLMVLLPIPVQPTVHLDLPVILLINKIRDSLYSIPPRPQIIPGGPTLVIKRYFVHFK